MSDWQTKQIKQFGRVVTGKTPPTDNPDYFDGGSELFVSPKDLDWNSFYVTETETRITEKALDKFRNQVLPKNSVMLCAFGDSASCYYTSCSSLYNSSAASLNLFEMNRYPVSKPSPSRTSSTPNSPAGERTMTNSRPCQRTSSMAEPEEKVLTSVVLPEKDASICLANNLMSLNIFAFFR
jgi:hypothetical protein